MATKWTDTSLRIIAITQMAVTGPSPLTSLLTQPWDPLGLAVSYPGIWYHLPEDWNTWAL